MAKNEFFPERIITTKDSKGNTYRSEVWTPAAVANWTMFGALGTAGLIGVFLPLVPVAALLLACLIVTEENRRLGWFLLSAGFSAYLLNDITNGWILSAFIRLMHRNHLKTSAILASSCFFISVVMMFWSQFFLRKFGRWGMIVVVLVMLLITHLILNAAMGENIQKDIDRARAAAALERNR
jgi:hypothetical protein